MKPYPIRHRAAVSGALAIGVLASLASALPISAALFLILDPTSGPPGTQVTGRTGGEGAFLNQVDPLPAFLVPRSVADGVTSRDDQNLVEVGQLVVDEAGNGEIDFRVPDVSPGDYVVMIFCPPCAAFSGGQVMAPVAAFTVAPLPPASAIAPLRLDWTWPLTVAVGALLAVASLLAARRRHRR